MTPYAALLERLEKAPAQVRLLEWLHRDDGQYGECKGRDLDALMNDGLVEWSSFARADQPQTGDYRWVRITDAGIAAIAALKATEGERE